MRYVLLCLLLGLTSVLPAQIPDSVAIKQVDSLIKVSRTFMDEGDMAKAADLITNAEKIASDKVGKESQSYANAVANHGRIFYYQADNAAAEKYYLEARDIRARILGVKHPDYGWSMTNLGTLYLQTGDLNKAEQCLTQARDIWGAALGKTHRWYAGAVNNLGNLHKEMGKFDEAESDYLEAKDIRAQSPGKESADYAWSLNNLANLYQDIGNYEAAEPLYLEAMAIREKIMGKNSLDYEGGLQGLGNLYILKGEFELAEKYHLEARDILLNHFGKDNRDYTFSLTNMSALYARMGNYKKAQALDLEALAIREQKAGVESSDYRISLNSLASHYTNDQQYDKAEPIYRQSLAICEKNVGKNHPDYALELFNLGVLYKKTGRFNQAESVLKEAAKIQAGAFGIRHRDYLETLWTLANCWEAAGKYRNSDSLYMALLPVVQDVYGLDHPYYANVLTDVASHEIRLKKTVDADRFLQTQAMLDRKHLRIASRHLSEQELAIYTQEFAEKIDLRFSEASISPAAMAGVCYDDILFYKGFLQQSVSRLRRISQANAETNDTYNRLNSYYRRLGDQYATPAADQSGVAALESAADSLEKVLARRIAGFSEAERQINWQEIRRALQANEAAIEFVQYRLHNPDETDTIRYAALVLSQSLQQPVFVPLCDERLLEAALLSGGQSRQLKINGLYSGESANHLFELIWKPVLPHLKNIHTLYYAPAGLLHRLNLGALPAPGGDIFADQFHVIELGSTRQLANPAPDQAAGNQAGLFGGIQYDESQTVADGTTPTDLSIKRGLDLAEIDSTARGNLPPWPYLKWTEVEVAAVEDLLKEAGYATTVFRGITATEKRLKLLGQSGASPRILHLATHGFFFPDAGSAEKADAEVSVFRSSSHPMIRSGLLFAGGNYAWKTGKPQHPGEDDGILTAYEISQLDLSHTELVVLSACETGLGSIQGNEGVYGLQRAFKIAGARYLIMSLWQVPDFQTQELMTEFYTQWLEEKKSIPEAFREAQNIMRKKYPEPYFWAGFILVE